MGVGEKPGAHVTALTISESLRRSRQSLWYAHVISMRWSSGSFMKSGSRPRFRIERLGIPPASWPSCCAFALSGVEGGLFFLKLSSMSQNHFSSLTLGFEMLSMI